MGTWDLVQHFAPAESPRRVQSLTPGAALLRGVKANFHPVPGVFVGCTPDAGIAAVRRGPWGDSQLLGMPERGAETGSCMPVGSTHTGAHTDRRVGTQVCTHTHAFQCTVLHPHSVQAVRSHLQSSGVYSRRLLGYLSWAFLPGPKAYFNKIPLLKKSLQTSWSLTCPRRIWQECRAVSESVWPRRLGCPGPLKRLHTPSPERTVVLFY